LANEGLLKKAERSLLNERLRRLAERSTLVPTNRLINQSVSNRYPRL
jgi:hypothetical protein